MTEDVKFMRPYILEFSQQFFLGDGGQNRANGVWILDYRPLGFSLAEFHLYWKTGGDFLSLNHLLIFSTLLKIRGLRGTWLSLSSWVVNLRLKITLKKKKKRLEDTEKSLMGL